MLDTSATDIAASALNALAGIQRRPAQIYRQLMADEPDEASSLSMESHFHRYRLSALDRALQDARAAARQTIPGDGPGKEGPGAASNQPRPDRSPSTIRLILAWIELEDRLRTALPMPGAGLRAAQAVTSLIDPAMDSAGPIIANILNRGAEIDIEIARIRIERKIDLAPEVAVGTQPPATPDRQGPVEMANAS